MFFPNESYFNVNDGVLGAVGFDDERPIAAWSRYHADALVARIAEYGNRLRAADWRVADTSARLAANALAPEGDRLRLQECVAMAVAERDVILQRLSEFGARARVMEDARIADGYAPEATPFVFEVHEDQVVPAVER